MSRLEYIHNQITEVNDELAYRLRDLKRWEGRNACPEVSYTKAVIKELAEKKITLQQIKDDLEAWESFKRNFKIGIDEKTNKIYVFGKDYYGYESCVFSLFKQDTNIIKKILEKKEDNNG